MSKAFARDEWRKRNRSLFFVWNPSIHLPVEFVAPACIFYSKEGELNFRSREKQLPALRNVIVSCCNSIRISNGIDIRYPAYHRERTVPVLRFQPNGKNHDKENGLVVWIVLGKTLRLVDIPQLGPKLLEEKMTADPDLPFLLSEVRACRVCEEYLPYAPRPVVSASVESRVLVIGQAPGRRVHESGIAWNDPSGDRLRDWLGVSKETFYDVGNFALIPMGFCYPGTGKQGDLPPRKECADLWHAKLLSELPNVRLTLLIGQYAQRFYLPNQHRSTLTHTVKNWREHTPRFLPLPHPSPRNNRWLKLNPWFSEEVLPYLRRRIGRYL